jgi:two-component system, sensor histidine kinase
MGGDVVVSSVEGKGSVFALSLPFRPANPALTAPAKTVAPILPSASIGKQHILIAEDNGTNRLILRKMLESDVVVLTEVANGAEAVARYCDTLPDLVVMDMQMPVMDGLSAIRAIRQHEQQAGLPRCPILVLSANVFPEDAQASFDADCDDFLTKPVLRDTLLATTSRLLAPGVADQPLPARRLLA